MKRIARAAQLVKNSPPPLTPHVDLVLRYVGMTGHGACMLGAEYTTARKGGSDCYNGWEFTTAVRWNF